MIYFRDAKILTSPAEYSNGIMLKEHGRLLLQSNFCVP